jgi:hypothetical protein
MSDHPSADERSQYNLQITIRPAVLHVKVDGMLWLSWSPEERRVWCERAIKTFDALALDYAFLGSAT